jgi:transcriptional regulator with XRE-family HTH domain
MKRAIKNRGLNERARKLGVSEGHLSRVASGERNSPELLDRYNALVAAEKAAGPLAEERAAMAGVTLFAERALPAFQACRNDNERIELAAELAAQISAAHPNFEEAFAAVEAALSIREKARLLDALLPFLAVEWRASLASVKASSRGRNLSKRASVKWREKEAAHA